LRLGHQHTRSGETGSAADDTDRPKDYKPLNLRPPRTRGDSLPDLLHLSERGYQTWAEAMEPTLAEMLK